MKENRNRVKAVLRITGKLCLLLPGILASAAAAILLLQLCNRVTNRMDPVTGIDEEGYAELCGQELAYSIRGNDTSNPIILWLHGGPGVPDMVATYFISNELADSYTFVNWNQRGCGRSYYRNLSLDPECETVTFEQALLDTDAMVDWVTERFGQSGVILVGYSYGSMLGVRYSMEHPDKVLAYIGVGQLAGEISPVPEESVYEEEAEEGHPILKAFTSPLLTWTDLKWLRSELNEDETFLYSQRFLFSYMYSTEVESFGMEFQMPVGFISGEYDEECPAEQVEVYFSEISAPEKQMTIVENRGHEFAVEAQEEFAVILSDMLDSLGVQASCAFR